MKKIYWQHSGIVNFGDDINELLWDRLVSNIDQIKPDDYILGVGTIIQDNLMPHDNKIIHVLGSGVGYSNFKNTLNSGRFNFVSVRGPLSAQLLGIHESLGIIDPAVLVADFEEFSKLERKEYVAFIPHWQSAHFGLWEYACKKAGITYISPCQDYMKVIRDIAEAKLIIAESMHGAIFADAFGVPWIPVSTSGMILPFKWMDWASSLQLPYEPYIIPKASSLVEAVYKAESVTTSQIIQKRYDAQAAKAELLNMLDKENVAGERTGFGLGLKDKFCRSLKHSRIDKLLSGKRIDDAANALIYVSKQTPYLSDRKILETKKKELLKRIQDFADEAYKIAL